MAGSSNPGGGWWDPDKYSGGLYQQPYWGGGTVPQNIQFSVPNYTTSFKVPQGVLNSRFNFNDAAGVAVPNAQNLDGSGTNAYGRIFNLNNGTVNSFYNSRIMDWNTFSSNRIH